MKKIAVNTVKSYLKDHKRDGVFSMTFQVGESSFDVVFHTVLSIDEKSTFVHRVITGCFDKLGNFRPEYVSPMLRATIMQMCTNLPALTLKGETDEDGVPAMDLNGMNELYLAMDLDSVQDAGYQAMLHEMVQLCGQAIDWKRNVLLADRRTDNGLRDLLTAITEKVDHVDIKSLMEYAGTLAESTKNLDSSNILNGLIQERMKENAG